MKGETPQRIADRLDWLAHQELDEVKRFLETLGSIDCAVVMIEACRCLDHIHVVQLISPKRDGKLPVHDFEILVRGWNVLFGLLMQRKGDFHGFPLI